MNFLRNTFSSFPYYKDPEPTYCTPLWNVYNGTSKKDSKVRCCVFEPNAEQLQMNKQFYTDCIANAKTLRFPGLVKVLEVFNDSTFCIVTERVTSITTFDLENSNAIALGLYQLSELFKTMNDNNIKFGSIDVKNIYLNSVGEWSLFQFPSHDHGSSSAIQQFIKFIKEHKYNTTLELPNNVLLKLASLQSFLKEKYNIVQVYDILKNEYPFLSHFNDSMDCLMELSKLLLPLNRAKNDSLEGLPVEFTSNFLFPFYMNFLNMPNEPIVTENTKIVPAEANLIFLVTLLYNCSCLDINIFKGAILNQFDKHDRQITFLLLKFHKKFIPTTKDILPNYANFNKDLYPRLVACLKDQDSQIRFETLKVFANGFIETMDLRTINNDFLRHLADVQNFDKDPLVKILVLKILCTQISEKLISYHGESKGLIILTAALCRHLSAKESVKVKKCVLELMAEKIENAKWPIDVLIGKLLPGVAPCMMDKNAYIRKQANHVFNKICDEIKRQTTLSESVDEADVSEEEDDLDDGDLNRYDIQIDDATLITEMLKSTGISTEVDLSDFQIPHNSNPTSTKSFTSPPTLPSVKSFSSENHNKLSTPDESLWDDPTADFEDNDNADDGWDSWNEKAPVVEAKTKTTTRIVNKPIRSSFGKVADTERKPLSKVLQTQKSTVVKKSSWLDDNDDDDEEEIVEEMAKTIIKKKAPISRLTARSNLSRTTQTTTKKAAAAAKPPSSFESLDDEEDNWGNDDW